MNKISMIQVTQTAVLADRDNIPALADEFERNGVARFQGFLAPSVLKLLLNAVNAAEFVVKNEVHEGRVFGTTLFVPLTDPAMILLHFILNRPALFEVVERIVGCPKLANFTGRLHRTSAESNQHIDWHDDVSDSRTVGITVNLGTEPYSGGALQVRDPEKHTRAEVGCFAAGDAFLFRIDRGWQHRLSPVESGSRTVGVGWFRTKPDWRDYNPAVVAARRAAERVEESKFSTEFTADPC